MIIYSTRYESDGFVKVTRVYFTKIVKFKINYSANLLKVYSANNIIHLFRIIFNKPIIYRKAKRAFDPNYML